MAKIIIGILFLSSINLFSSQFSWKDVTCLSAVETNIIHGILDGMTNDEIVWKSETDLKNIEIGIMRLLIQTGAKSRSELLLLARENNVPPFCGDINNSGANILVLTNEKLGTILYWSQGGVLGIFNNGSYETLSHLSDSYNLGNPWYVYDRIGKLIVEVDSLHDKAVFHYNGNKYIAQIYVYFF